MRTKIIGSALLVGVVGIVACAENPTAFDVAEGAVPASAVSSGETFSYIKIVDPSSTAFSLGVGATKQMSGTLFYSKGGTLPSSPYAQWSSTDNCVAKVTSASPSWGLVQGVQAGKALIIATTFGKADTVEVAVTGTGNLDPACAEREWSWDYSDISFTGSPAKSYAVSAGERLTQLVLFAPKDPVVVGAKVTVRSELWYNKGGKLNGKGYVSFSTTDGSIATINSKGIALGRAPGRVKVIVRLGQFADTVPLYVK